MWLRLFVMVIIGELSGCGASPEARLQKLIEQATSEFQKKNEAHESAWGLGQGGRWDLDQEDGRLIFTFPDKTVVCEAQIIGSYSTKSGTWLWAWDNPSILAPMKTASERVRDFGRQQGFAKLTTAKWPATESDGWEMAALAAHLTGREGVYRGPAGDTYAFIIFGTPKIEKH